MTIKAFLFDHDGTLVDSESTHLALWRKTLEPFNVTISNDDYLSFFLGVPTEKTAEILCKKHNLPLSSESLVCSKVNHTRHFLTHSYFPKMSGAGELLIECASRLPVALVSGSQRFCIDATLAGHQWGSLFAYIVTGDDVLNNKPHPDSYLKALDLLGVRGNEAITIEDTESGVKASTSAGIRTVAIRNQYSLSHDFSKADVEVANLAEAKAWIRTQLSS